jgi:hypothetical protein
MHTGVLTINVPIVNMVRDIMILMRENPFRGPLEGVGHENRDFFGPEMARSEASAIWAQKSQEFLYSVFYILYSVFCIQYSVFCILHYLCEFACMSFAAAV